MTEYPKTIITVQSYLKQMGVLNNVQDIIENEESTALVLVLKKTRFFGECVTLNRISRSNYHINYGAYHRRARTAKQSAKILQFIIQDVTINNCYQIKEILSKRRIKKNGISRQQ